MRWWVLKGAFFALCLGGFHFARTGQHAISAFLFGIAGYLAGLHDGVEFQLSTRQQP